MNIGDIYTIRPKDNDIYFSNFDVIIEEINHIRQIVRYIDFYGFEEKCYISKFLQKYEFNQKLTDQYIIRDIIE